MASAANKKPLWLAGSLALLFGAGGCFFTDKVNEAPVAGIRTYQDGPYFIGQLLSFDATKTVDDVTSDLICEWQAFACDDQQTPDCEFIASDTGGLEERFEIRITSHSKIVIELRVTDELGATRAQPDLLTIDISNREPALDLQVLGNREQPSDAFILYRPIDLVIVPDATNSGMAVLDPDGDEVELSWQLFAPPGSQPSARSFEPVGDDGYKLIPDVPGMWRVVLSADDGFGGEAEVEKEIFVGVDAAPCLTSVDPFADATGNYLVQSADGPRPFSVLSVTDALDPFPASLVDDAAIGLSTFRWYLKAPGAASFSEILGHGSETYLVDPLAYEPGDLLELRVEVEDRVRGPERQLACADDARACELVAGSQCFQRLTWGAQIQ